MNSMNSLWFRGIRSLLIIGLVAAVAPAGAEDIEADSVLIRLIHEVDVPARVLGALVEVEVSEGNQVRAGQVLAQIDDHEVQIRYQRAESESEIARLEAADDVAIRSAQESMQFANADWKRLQRAEEERPRSVSESELEKARLDALQAALDLERANSDHQLAQLKASVAAQDLKLAKREVELRQITAPIDGEVVRVAYSTGEWVKPGDQVLRIVRTDRLRAEGFVNAADVVGDLRGASVVVTPMLNDRFSQTCEGRIVYVSPEIDPVNGQVRVWADVDNSEGRLRPGMRGSMTIKSPQPK